jgi:hypothetical protein
MYTSSQRRPRPKVFKYLHITDSSGTPHRVLVKGQNYPPLVDALVKRMTPTQIDMCLRRGSSHSSSPDMKFILFSDIRNCFVRVNHGLADFDIDHSITHCICNVYIKQKYCIQNIAGSQIHLIGSKCIHHWSPNEYKRIIREVKITKNPDARFCRGCGKKIDKRNCSSCNSVLRTRFRQWLSLFHYLGANEEITIGKVVKGLSYYEVIKKTKYSSWVNFVLSDKFTNDKHGVRDTLLYYKYNREQYEYDDEGEEIEVEYVDNYLITVDGVKYYSTDLKNGELSEYIDDETAGETIGQLVDGKIVLE